MMRAHLLGCAIMLTTACGGDAKDAQPAPAQRQNTANRAQPVAQAPDLYDAQGRLKPSGRMLHWFEIPMGFENTASWSKHHVFESSQVSVEKLREYLGARMLTGRVDELGRGAVYKGVMPLSAEASAMRFDVQVGLTQGGRVVRLDLEELNFPGVEPLSPEQAAEAMRRDRALAE